MREKRTSVLVIGSGIAGLSAAIELADQGKDVLVISAAPELHECNTAYAHRKWKDRRYLCPDIVDPANTLTVWVQNTAYWGKPMITVDTNGTWYAATCYECNFTKYGMGSSSIQHGLHRIINQKIIYSLLYIMDTSYTPLENPDLICFRSFNSWS
jgi:hypothetical protein